MEEIKQPAGGNGRNGHNGHNGENGHAKRRRDDQQDPRGTHVKQERREEKVDQQDGPKRPGEAGTKVILHANAFEIRPKCDVIYKYVVEFDPPVDPQDLERRRALISGRRRTLRDKLGFYAFDGQCVIAFRCVPDPRELELPPLTEGGHRISLRLTTHAEAANIDQRQDFTTMVNVMLRHVFALPSAKLLRMGRFFFRHEQKQLPNNAFPFLRFFPGFAASVVSTINNHQLLMDLKYKFVHQMTIRQEMDRAFSEVMGRNANPTDTRYYVGPSYERYKQLCRERLIGMAVITSYNYASYRIEDIDFTRTPNHTFRGKDGNEVTFAQYIQNRYVRVHVTRPDPGLILTHASRKARERGEAQIVLLPEFCQQTGISDELADDASFRKALSLETRKPPSQRIDAISNNLCQVLFDAREDMDRLREVITIDKGITKVYGRVLPPVQIITADGRRTPADRATRGTGRGGGQGRGEPGPENKFPLVIRESGFFPDPDHRQPVVRYWSLVADEADSRDYLPQHLADSLVNISQMQGGPMGRPHILWARGKDTNSWGEKLTEAVSAQSQLVVCLIPNGDEALYSFCKHFLQVDNKVDSQMVSTRKAREFLTSRGIAPAYSGNLFKQIMAKLGFVNWRVELAQTLKCQQLKNNLARTMVCGIAMCQQAKSKHAYGENLHPNKATVACVASYDDQCTKFVHSLMFQDKHAAILTEPKDLMYDILAAYHSKNQYWPTNIIVYRDGLSEGAFESIVHEEIAGFKRAFRDHGMDLSKTWLTVIVINKKTTTRFFLRCQRHYTTQKNARVEACFLDPQCPGKTAFHSPQCGTVVDSGVVSLYNRLGEFFVVANKPPAGSTAMPTRYVVVHDDLRLCMDDLEQFTHALCYLYSNWPGPIRVPAPVFYAGKLAKLHGTLVNGSPNIHLKDLFFI